MAVAVKVPMRRLLIISLATVLFAGCAINRKPLRQNTASLEEADPALQAQVARGQVSVGFTPEMVQRALGEPAKIKAKASGNSVVTTWTYLNQADQPMHLTFKHGQVAEIRHGK